VGGKITEIVKNLQGNIKEKAAVLSMIWKGKKSLWRKGDVRFDKGLGVSRTGGGKNKIRILGGKGASFIQMGY